MTNERSALCRKHQEEWDAFRKQHLLPCIINGDEAQAKFIKIVADTLRITQDSERRALLMGEGINDDGVIEIEWGA